MCAASASRIHVRAGQQRRDLQVAEIALPFVGGEARVQRHADCRCCDREDRHTRLGAGRQCDRHAIGGAYPQAPQFANRLVHAHPERAICHGTAVGRQDGIASGRYSRIMSKKLFEMRKDAAVGPLARRSALHSLDEPRQAALLFADATLLLQGVVDVPTRGRTESFRACASFDGSGGTALDPWADGGTAHAIALREKAGKLLVLLQCVGAEAAEPFIRAFERLQLGHREGKKVPIIRSGILAEEVAHQTVDQPGHAILHSNDCSARQPEAWHCSIREIVQPAEERSGPRLPFYELECLPQVRVSCEQIAFLARRRREPVAPKRNSIDDRGKFGPGPEVRLGTRGKDHEIECEGAGLGGNLRNASLVADGPPFAIGMPNEILELATTPEGILRRRLRKVLQYVAHESPALQVGQLPEVTEHAREVRPEQRIDTGDIRTAEAEVDPCGARFECRGRIVESRSADAEHTHALSRKSAEVYVVNRMGMTLRDEVSHELPRSPPFSASFNTGCEHDLARINALDPAFLPQMGEKKITCRLDQCYFTLVLDRKLQNIAVPIEIFAPYLRRKRVNALPGLATEACLVPGTRREARDPEVDAGHLLGRPQALHAGKSAPRPFESARITIDDPEIGDPLALQAECYRKSGLTTADDQHIEDPSPAPIARDRPLVRRIAQIRQIASHPISQLGNTHGPRPIGAAGHRGLSPDRLWNLRSSMSPVLPRKRTQLTYLLQGRRHNTFRRLPCVAAAHRPVRASECTQPTMRDCALAISSLVKKSSGFTRSTG